MAQLREELERLETMTLSPYASFSAQSRGRDREEAPCELRPVYQRDRDRILHCKSFRRMKHKTQVFLAPEGDHYRTRLTHTLEVAQIARTIGRALRLNEDLIEAIALGHDLGHTPFGHCGERVLNRLTEGRFTHYEQGIRIVERLEKDGHGLNLTWEVRDGIRNHSMSRMPSTLEGRVVRYADKIAYINHDIDDALRGHIIQERDLPRDCMEIMGHSTKERLNSMIRDIIFTSDGTDTVCMTPLMEQTMMKVRQYMFEHVYVGTEAKQEELKAERLLEQIFNTIYKTPEWLPEHYIQRLEEGENPTEVICDYIAGMSDNYAVDCFNRMYVPRKWDVY